MTAVAYAHLTIGRFAIADSMLQIASMRRSNLIRSPEISQAIFEDVKAVVMVTLNIEDQADDLGPQTGLYGNLPELDSLTVVKLIVALQKRFGIEIKIDEIVGDIFDTLGRLAAFVQGALEAAPRSSRMPV